MQILKNVALFQINNNPVEYMLINTLFGTVEILDEEEAKIVAIWIERELGEQLPPEEVKLFDRQRWNGKVSCSCQSPGVPPPAPPSGGRIGRRRVADARKRGRKTLP